MPRGAQFTYEKLNIVSRSVITEYDRESGMTPLVVVPGAPVMIYNLLAAYFRNVIQVYCVLKAGNRAKMPRITVAQITFPRSF